MVFQSAFPLPTNKFSLIFYKISSSWEFWVLSSWWSIDGTFKSIF